MKYNNLSILVTLVFSFFIFFSPSNVNAQINITEEPSTISNTDLTKAAKIEDYINKYLEIKLINGKTVKGKLVENKDNKLIVKDGLIKKQISSADIASFEMIKSPSEKFKEGMETTGFVALTIIAIPVLAPVELILHANGDCLENH